MLPLLLRWQYLGMISGKGITHQKIMSCHSAMIGFQIKSQSIRLEHMKKNPGAISVFSKIFTFVFGDLNRFFAYRNADCPTLFIDILYIFRTIFLS